MRYRFLGVAGALSMVTAVVMTASVAVTGQAGAKIGKPSYSTPAYVLGRS